MPHRIAVAIACLLVTSGSVAGEAPRSPRNADYTIDVRLDPDSHRLTGSQVLKWTNLRTVPTSELRFHLYWNAWRNDRSTWLDESRLSPRRRAQVSAGKAEEEDWGWTRVKRARLEVDWDAGSASTLPEHALVDLTDRLRYDAPDSGNVDDRTVLVVPLPAPVGPGETVRLHMDWESRIPRTFARTGRRGDYYFIAHWFPAVGVFEGEAGWNCHEFHVGTEFFSDYGVYDVRITVPSRWEIGATGARTGAPVDHPDGMTTFRFVQEDVHTFTWTTSPDYLLRKSTFDEPGLPSVELRLLIQPEHLDQAERHFEATRAALKHYGTWYGPYPYPHLTIVDPAYGSSTGGMEYPTIFTCGTRFWSPFGGDSPESVTVHEAGHQFWYGVIGNNEFEHAWIDEGLNTFSTLRTLDVAYGPRKYVRRFLPMPGLRSRAIPVLYPDIEEDRWADRRRRFRDDATSDVPLTPTFLYHPASGGSLSYSKTALWLRTLERHLGWETLRRGMSTFYRRHAFGHPTPGDFVGAIEEAAGHDLGWFFDQVLADDVDFDYAIDSASSSEDSTRGWVESDGAMVTAGDDEGSDDSETVWRNEVVVRRLGQGVFPVDVLLQFDDGSERRRSWDGRSRWLRWVERSDGKLVRAVVDPEEVVQLDLSRLNNEWRIEPADHRSAVKWSSQWMLWFQDLMLTYAALM